MTAYRAQPLTAPIEAIVMVLAARARDGHLVICAGAGLSVAQDAALPSGQRLGEMLHARFDGRLEGYVAPADTGDLIDVADAAVAAMGNLLPLQYEILELADFEGATPNFGHRTTALLLAEGAVSNMLLWNWDDCVERSAPEGERLQVARTLDDVEQLRLPSVAKIHGCATRVPTLLITSDQLRDPPLWTEAAFSAQLRTATAVFVGIGDVADYAKRRISKLVEDIPELDVYVVSPGIAARWDESVWAILLPTLLEDRRIGKSADEFLDQLARAWALDLVDAVGRLAAPMTAATLDGTTRTIRALKQMSGSELIAWCRAAAFRHRVGHSVVRCPEAQEAAVALGVLAGEDPAEVTFVVDGRCRFGESSYYEILIACGAANATDVRSEAHRRAERLSGRGLIENTATFLVSGTIIGPLSQPEADDIFEGETDPADVFSGSRGIELRFIPASDVVARAA
jgi:hypothetical protein